MAQADAIRMSPWRNWNEKITASRALSTHPSCSWVSKRGKRTPKRRRRHVGLSDGVEGGFCSRRRQADHEGEDRLGPQRPRQADEDGGDGREAESGQDEVLLGQVAPDGRDGDGAGEATDAARKQDEAVPPRGGVLILQREGEEERQEPETCPQHRHRPESHCHLGDDEGKAEATALLRDVDPGLASSAAP